MKLPSEYASPPAVSVRKLTKRYGSRVVLDNFELDVRTGEIVALIGANGAGKTTAVECIQGLRSADSGEIAVLGFNPAREADRLRPLIGSQLQSSGLPDRLRVHEAVQLFATRRTGDALELVRRFGLGQKTQAPFASLSGGEQQRLFLILALLNKPRLLVLDELTQGLDPEARKEVWSSVRSLRSSGTTVLLVTHELVEAETLCDEVVAMKSGRILDAGSPADLVARYADLATTKFSVGRDEYADVVHSVKRLQGVDSVSHKSCGQSTQVTVEGNRSSIAYVGAWLTQREEIPSDLRVESPTLETALMGLLNPAEAHAVEGRTL